MGEIYDVVNIAVIILIIVILVVFMTCKAGTSAATGRSGTVAPLDPIEKLVQDEIPQATHIAKYGMVSVDDGKPIPVADYTNVPYKFGKYLKPFEPEGVKVVDDKVDTVLYVRSDNVEEESIMQQERAKTLIQSALLDSYTNPMETSHTNFIKSLDVNKSCVDAQPELCEQWKNNNECLINPEYMLFNCPSACGSCNMSDGQKNLLSIIYNRRDPVGCVSHGGYQLEHVEFL